MAEQPARPAPSPPGITKAQELVYDLKISQVMTTPVATVERDTTMSELRELLRTRKISGTPVLEGDRLVGIVSIEDLLKCLAQGSGEEPEGSRLTHLQHAAGRPDPGDEPVEAWMSRDVITAMEHVSVIEAVKTFAEFGLGRLPVVDNHGRVVGILTGGDITRGLLRAIDLDYHHEEIERYRASHIFEDIVSDDTSMVLRYRVRKGDFDRGGEASSKIRRALHRLGASPQALRRVGIACYEAEMNLVIHTLNGGEITAEVQPHRVRIVAEDRGPGIEDIERALEPGYSTAPEWIRELGFGAGMGLQNIRKCSDDMQLTSRPGDGTRLEIVVRLGSNGRPAGGNS